MYEMHEKIDGLKMAVAACVGLLTGLWGWLGWLVLGWILCMALDWVTGYLAAMHNGEGVFPKGAGRRWHKGGMLVVVLVAAGTDMLLSIVLSNLPLLELPVEYPGLICPMVLVWYIVGEMVSITENAVHMGANVPPWLVRLLAISKGMVDQAGEALGGKEDGHE